MTIDWSPLTNELAIWQRASLPLSLWWRDDDAIEDTPAFQKLLRLAAEISLTVHVAVIPKNAQPSLVAACAATPCAVPIVHGWAHESHAPQGQKKAEFGHPRADAIDEAAEALAKLQAMFGDALLPMFVPPWNRIDPGVVAELPGAGFVALSTYTPRKDRYAAPGLVQINTHMDPINWRGGGELVPPKVQIDALVQLLKDRRSGRADASEPLGFLTHHLVHDGAIWDFTRDCLSCLLDHGAVPLNLHKLKDDLP